MSRIIHLDDEDDDNIAMQPQDEKEEQEEEDDMQLPMSQAHSQGPSTPISYLPLIATLKSRSGLMNERIKQIQEIIVENEELAKALEQFSPSSPHIPTLTSNLSHYLSTIHTYHDHHSILTSHLNIIQHGGWEPQEWEQLIQQEREKRETEGKQGREQEINKKTKELEKKIWAIHHSGEPFPGDIHSDDLIELVTPANVNECICPITLDLFRDPVKNNGCDHTYEREAILNLIQSKKKGVTRCPKAGCSAIVNCSTLSDDVEMRVRAERLTKHGVGSKKRIQHIKDDPEQDLTQE